MDVNWEMLVSEAVTQLIKIFVPVLIVLVLKWCVEIWKKLNEKNPELANLIAYAAQVGYAAAEDYFRNVKSASGEDKMVYAISRAQEYLLNAGESVDDEVIKDSITQFGVNNQRFSWTKPTFSLAALLQNEEKDNESGDADHLCVGNCGDSDHADSNTCGEQPAGSDQEAAADEDGERLPTLDED
ncbi:MAG: hypothetical protein IJI14_19565 [Anaerolineaceae bacterium]|nr:hypothetical protein [Anaerolineaceae bacterium]